MPAKGLFAGKPAPTRYCACLTGTPLGLIRRRRPGCLVVLVVIAVCCFRGSRMRANAPARPTGAVNDLIVHDVSADYAAPPVAGTHRQTPGKSSGTAGPEEVTRIGITVDKASPDLTMVVHLTSPDKRYDMLYLSNYALLNIKDELARLGGVGDVQLFGMGDYSLRVWLDPNKTASRNLTATDVVTAIREQNRQVADHGSCQPGEC